MLRFTEWTRRVDADLHVFGDPFWTDDLGRPAASPRIQAEAAAYCLHYRLPTPNHAVYVACDQLEHGRIADAYDALPLEDLRPAVADAYHALGAECVQQYQWAQQNGMVFEPWIGDPYDGNVFEALEDVATNRHLYFFTGGEPNPFMRAVDPASGYTVNDVFRAIHDYYGHACVGADFGPIGEENAWVSHVQMFSVTARRALSVETRGQNSWVNFGRQNYDDTGHYLNIPPSARPYAIQKTGIFDGHNAWINDVPRTVRPASTNDTPRSIPDTCPGAVT